MDAGIKVKQLKIDGMTCISCQNKIDKKLKTMAGVQKVSVSYSTGIVEITYDTDIISLQDIKVAIESLDYHVVQESGINSKKIRRAVVIMLVILGMYALLQYFGILNMLVPSQLADTKMGYGMLFVIGLVTSIHCVAMCGGINLSQCIPRENVPGTSDGRIAVFRPALLYNIGRVISYTVIGGTLGFIGFLFGGGSEVGIPVMAQGILKLIAGIFMVIMGINMLGIFPWLRRFQPHMPQFIARRINGEKSKNRGPLLVGLLNGLMPCGPLQAMQIVALASGNPVSGALSMLMFSLGTVPLMLGLGSVVLALGKKFMHQVMNIGAVLVVVLGLAMLSQGGSLSGLISSNTLFFVLLGFGFISVVSILPFNKQIHRYVALSMSVFLVVIFLALAGTGISSIGNATIANSSIQIVDGKQIINSTLTAGSYPEITVEEGIPVEWTIYAPAGSINGCNSRMSIEEYGIIDYELKEGNNVIEFTPETAGNYQYSCWMGMIRSSISVLKADGTLADTTDDGSAQLPAGCCGSGQ